MGATLDARLRLNSAEFSGGLNKAVREANSAVGKMSAQFSSLRNIFGAGAVGAFGTQLFQSVFTATAEAEKLQAAMSATMGSAVLGKAVLGDVRKLAGDIGLDVRDAARAMIQFQSAGMKTADALDAVRVGFNAILSSGGGQNEFSRFAVAIQQLRNSPKPLQEEINQLREALPITARLMQDAFGASRAEDLQRLGITGEQFVNRFLAAMRQLPEVGDTMEKQLGRMKAQWEQLKVDVMGTRIGPISSAVMAVSSQIMESVKALDETVMGDIGKMFGVDLQFIKRLEGVVQSSAEKQRDANEAQREALKQAQLDQAAKTKSIEQGKTLAGVFEKFNAILAETKRVAKEARDALNFDDLMRAFTDANQQDALENNLDAIRATVGEAIKAKREMQDAGKAAQMQGNQDAIDAVEGMRAEKINEMIANKLKSRSERRAERDEERRFKRAQDSAARQLEKEMLKKERDEFKKNQFDNQKKGKFWDEEEAKKRLRKDAQDAVKKATEKSAMTLQDILTVLKTLATA